MADGFVTIGILEQRNIYADIAPSSGTETIVSVSVTLYDASGAVAGSVSGTTIVQGTNGGWTVAADADPQAWYFLAPTVLGLTAGYYRLVFKITDNAAVPNIFRPVIGVKVKADYA